MLIMYHVSCVMCRVSGKERRNVTLDTETVDTFLDDEVFVEHVEAEIGDDGFGRL